MEQATHFVDLMRFFAGEILEDTVKAVAVGPEQKLVDMPAAPEGEHEVIVAQQLPYNCHDILKHMFYNGWLGAPDCHARSYTSAILCLHALGCLIMLLEDAYSCSWMLACSWSMLPLLPHSG